MQPFSTGAPRLIPSLLLSDELAHTAARAAGAGPRGSYNPMQFALRLRKDVQDALDSESLTYRKVHAFSTYLHENIHWWQHVGSHLGFITSLNYPAVAHAAHRDLTKLLARGEKYKPIIAYDHLLGGGRYQHGNQLVNILLHNWYDTYYAKLFIWDNKEIGAIAEDRRFFLSVGHSFHMLWVTSIETLASTIDPDYTFLPNTSQWHQEFRRLEREQAVGFVTDAREYHISPLGTRALFEGQARFNQLQYLTIALSNQVSYADFKAAGMLDGIYAEAFDIFLKISGIARPANLNNPVVGLFLLLCDIAINPTDGFPTDVVCLDTFIIANDPGFRFTMLCRVVAEDRAQWLARIVSYSGEEYRQLSEELCREIACHSPLKGSEVVASWALQQESVRQVMWEESVMKFAPHNLSIRLFFSKYVRFQQDKLNHPNLFCWPGKCLAGEASSDLTPELVKSLFDKHRALFIENGDGEIRPILFDGYPEENIMESFNDFYEYNISYDMITKWLHESGPFSYEYDWLTSKLDKSELKDWVRNGFKDLFGIYPEDLVLL